MHRTNRVPHTALGIMLLSLMLGDLAASGLRAADEAAPPQRREGGPVSGNRVILPIGSTQPLQMKDRKVIKQVINPKDNVAIVAPKQGDPRSVIITGRDAGMTRVTLTAEDDTAETYAIIVQVDVEYLRSVLQRTVPTANLNLIPGAGNTIIIAGTVAHSEDIDIIMRAAGGFVPQPINAMRVGGVMQVQLDVVVAQVKRSELRSLGLDFLNTGAQHTFSSTPSGVPALSNPAAGSNITNIPTVATPIANAFNPQNGMFLGLYNNQQAFFGVLQALRQENLAKLLAEPRLLTLSGHTATFASGGDQPVPNGGGLGGVSFGFERFGTTVTFLPIVMGNGKIYLEVEPEVSNLSSTITTPVPQTTGFIQGRDIQRVHTSVEMEDGQTFAIGGLIQHVSSGVTHKIPVLGDLPFLGTFFSSKSFNDEEEELVVMVTPHLVDPMSCDQLPKLLPGQETRIPDDFELFLEGILEAPRGPRNVFPNCHYMPAYLNGPTAEVYPCAADPGHCCDKGKGGCGGCKSCAPGGTTLNGYPTPGNCGNGNCANGASAGASVKTAAAPAAPATAPADAATTVVNKPATSAPTGHADLLPPVEAGDLDGKK